MKTLTVKVSVEMHKRLKNASLDASRDGPRVSMAEIVRRALEAYLKGVRDGINR